jgi:hypothetical protein
MIVPLEEKEGWRCGSSSRALALQVPTSEFKPRYHQTKKARGRDVGAFFLYYAR